MHGPVGRCLGIRIFNIINASFYLVNALESPTSKTCVIFKTLFSVSIKSSTRSVWDAIQIICTRHLTQPLWCVTNIQYIKSTKGSVILRWKFTDTAHEGHTCLTRQYQLTYLTEPARFKIQPATHTHERKKYCNNLWPKYKQNGAEVNYLKEKQRARSEIEYNFSRNMTSTNQTGKVKYINYMTDRRLLPLEGRATRLWVDHLSNETNLAVATEELTLGPLWPKCRERL